MKRLLQHYGILGLSLLTLFASGICIGRFTSNRQAIDPSPAAATTGVIDAAAWSATASQHLTSDLQLTADQQAKVHQELEPVAEAMRSDQERTLFQMHLRLLLLHDKLAAHGSLDTTQLQRLGTSRAKLKSLIIQKFPRMVRENPSLAFE